MFLRNNVTNIIQFKKLLQRFTRRISYLECEIPGFLIEKLDNLFSNLNVLV